MQTSIEQYESRWMHYRDLVNIRAQFSKAKKGGPKISGSKLEKVVFRSFFLGDIPKDVPSEINKEGGVFSRFRGSDKVTVRKVEG